MGTLSKKTSESVFDMSKTLTKDDIAKRLGIKEESVSRYLRYYRKFTEKPWNEKPNILLLDIETTTIKSRTWGVWKQNLNPVQIIEPSVMLSWAAKWLFEPDVYGDIMTPQEAVTRDDKRISTSLWPFMESANVIIAHNGQAFDVKRINTRFLVHGLGRPAPYKVIDTCLIARSEFAFEHNKLDYLAERLGLIRKIDTDFQLWIDCENGKKSALKKMLKYNKNDVMILEEVYIALRPWIKNHPNLGLFMDYKPGERICRNCGSKNMEYVGYYYTPVNKYKSFRCTKCGAIARMRRSEVSLTNSPHVLQQIS